MPETTAHTQAPAQIPPRRRRKETLDVTNMPPPWRRSLTESGMKRVTTWLDVAAVAGFVVGAVLIAAWIVLAH